MYFTVISTQRLQKLIICVMIIKNIGHRRTVHRSVGDRKRQLAGRLSDKMSSELGYYLGNSRVILFCGGYYGFRNF